MPSYTITFEAQLFGERIVYAEDIRAAIESLDDDYFSKFDLVDLAEQKFLITGVGDGDGSRVY